MQIEKGDHSKARKNLNLIMKDIEKSRENTPKQDVDVKNEEALHLEEIEVEELLAKLKSSEEEEEKEGPPPGIEKDTPHKKQIQ